MGADPEPGTRNPIHARTLSPREIGRLIGRRDAHGVWKAFDKRSVQDWCVLGVGDSVCPHDEETISGVRHFRLNLDEALAWRRKVGRPGLPRPPEADDPEAVRAAEAPLIADAEARKKAGELEEERRARERVEAMRLALAEIATGDPIALIRRHLMELHGKIAECTAATSTETLRQITASAATLNGELRKLDELERDREEHAGRLMSRESAARILGELAAAVRGRFAAVGAVLARRVLEAAAGVEATGGGAEARERVGAIEAQRMIDDTLTGLAESAEMTAAELEHGEVGGAWFGQAA